MSLNEIISPLVPLNVIFHNVDVTGSISGTSFSSVSSAGATLTAGYTFSGGTPVSSGLGVAITAGPQGVVLATSISSVYLTSAGNAFTTLYRSIVGTPSQGATAAVGDVKLAQQELLLPGVTGSLGPVSINFLDHVTPGTTYTYYMAVSTTSGGTQQLNNNATANSTSLTVLTY